MGEIIIDSKVIEEKIHGISERIQIFDDLYSKLSWLNVQDTYKEYIELPEMVQEVRQMRQVTEDMHELLKSFFYSMGSIMLQNKKEVCELQEMIEQLFS